MRTSWKLINKEVGKDHINHGLQSVNINGRSTSNHQTMPMPLISILQLSPI